MPLIESIDERYLIPLLVAGGIILLISLFVLYHGIRVMHLKLTLDRFKRQRRKRQNGDRLLLLLEKYRKEQKNTYKGLKKKGRKLVNRYFTYKARELHYITLYKTRSRFTFKGGEPVIQVSQIESSLDRGDTYTNPRQFVKLTNRYECLEEFILYLHEMPDKIMSGQPFEYFLSGHDVLLSYKIR